MIEQTIEYWRDEFRASSTTAMPIAGSIFWSLAAIFSLTLPLGTTAIIVAAGSGSIFPMALLIDKLRGRPIMAGDKANPVTKSFLLGMVTIALLWPLVIIGAIGNPLFIILGAAILMALVWIPFGWAANDPVGLHHAIGRSIGCYGAYLLAPTAVKSLAICLVVILAYLYSFWRMRKD